MPTNESLSPTLKSDQIETVAAVRAREVLECWSAKCGPSSFFHPADHAELVRDLTKAFDEAARFEYEEETIFELLRKYLADTDPHGDLRRPINLDGFRFQARAVVKFIRWAFAPLTGTDHGNS